VKQRRSKLLKFAKKINCDTLVAFDPENLFYMTGFWGEAIGILDNRRKTTIIAPKLEVERAKNESISCNVVTADRGIELISSLVSKIKGNKVCTDCQNYSTMLSLKKSVRGIKHSVEPFYNSRVIKHFLTDCIRHQDGLKLRFSLTFFYTIGTNFKHFINDF